MRCSKWGAAAHTSNHEAKLQGMVNIFLFLASLRAYPPGLLFQYLHKTIDLLSGKLHFDPHIATTHLSSKLEYTNLYELLLPAVSDSILS